MEVVHDSRASLLPDDLLLDIFRRLETTAIIRCACACKSWRRAIISNASSLRLRQDRFNPNLLLGFFHRSWNVNGRWLPLPMLVSVTTVDTGICKRLSSLIPAASTGGVDLSLCRRILSSRDGLLLQQLRRGSSKNDELCVSNPTTQDCMFLPLPSIMDDCEYTLLSASTPSGDDEHGTVRILAKAGRRLLCTEDDRLTYQVFSCGRSSSGGSSGIWGPLQRSEEVNKGFRMLTYCRNAVVARDGVYWLAGPQLSGSCVTCTVGLDIYTGRAWAMELPTQCRFFYSSKTLYTLTTSGNGRLSLLQPLEDRHIQVWVLDGDGDAMEWTVQHKISLDANLLSSHCHYSNVVCPRSGFLFIMLLSSRQLRINLDSHSRNPAQCIGKRGPCDYYPYETDWSTYISNMKKF